MRCTKQEGRSLAFLATVVDYQHRRHPTILWAINFPGHHGLQSSEARFVISITNLDPRGVLLALRNAAKYYRDGKVEEVPGPQLMGTAKPYFIYPGFAFVAYPNRDSTPYKERYNIPEANTIIRGTLRYQGFPEFVRALVDMGFLSEDKHDFLEQSISWKEATQKVLGASSDKEA